MPPGGIVVRIDAHAAGTEDHIGLLCPHIQNRVPNVFHAVSGIDDFQRLNAAGFQFPDYDRCERVPDEAGLDLAAGGDNACRFAHERAQCQKRCASGCLLRFAKLFFLNHQRNDAHACKLVALVHGRAALAGGDHDLVLAVYRNEPRRIDQKHAAACRAQFNLALFYLRAGHVFLSAQGQQPLGCIVFIKLRIVSDVGARLPIYCTSQGKVFLASRPPQEAECLLRRLSLAPFTPYTVTDVQELMQELDACRANGYAIENGEYKIGLRSISAPVYTVEGEVRYTVSVIGMFRSVHSDEFQVAVNCVQDTARMISTALGYQKQEEPI